jgi:anti-sigma regulatory factor (Ser/Thr protein kinase)
VAGQASPELVALFETAARAIHGERERDRMVSWAANAIASAAGASIAGLALDSDPDPPLWVVAAGSPPDLAVLGDPRTFAELAAALRGEGDRAPQGTQLRRLLGVTALRLAPIPRFDGGVHGVVLLGWSEGDGLPENRLATVEALIAHLGVALDNHGAIADREAVQRGVVHKLQEAVRPPTPSVPHTELGVYYLAADQQASTGGDLYDWVLLPDGDLHLAVVDVMGKGVTATKDAVAVTHALRLLVLDGCPLDRVIARADALVTAQNPDLVATLIVGRYDPRTGVLSLAGGGHPPALVLASGEVCQVEAGGVPIGFPGAGSGEQVTLTLQRSDTVIFYTDGLIETTKDVIKGLESLARHAGDTARYPAGSLARALVDRTLEGAVRRDDSLALVLRRRTPPPDSSHLPLAPFEYRFSPNMAAVPLARHFLQDWLVRVPVEPAEAADLLLVATELAANAVHHASAQPGSILIRASVSGPDIVVEVEDDGGHPVTLPDPADDLPEPLAERGRGLFLVRALADELDSEVVAGHTRVRAVRRAVVAGTSRPGR